MSCRFIKPLSMTPPIGWAYVEPADGYVLPWGDGTLSKAINALVLHRRGNSLPRADAQMAQDDIILFTCELLASRGLSNGWCDCGTTVKFVSQSTGKGCAVCGSRKKRR